MNIIQSPEQLKININTRLQKLRKCCVTCETTWNEWDLLIKTVINSIEKQPHEFLYAIINCLTEIQKNTKKFNISENLIEMQKDGSINSLLINHHLQKELLLNPIKLLKSNEINKFLLILDNDENVTGSAKQYLYHMYSKLLIGYLNDEKEKCLFKLHTRVHRNYNSNNNKLYPLIKLDGSPFKIKKINSISSNNKYSCSQVKPFISNNITDEERSYLYEEKLVVREIGPSTEFSSKQYGVFAKKNINKFICIGVHGGVVILKDDVGVDIICKINQDYLVYLSSNILLDGHNILSKINSNFYKNKKGKWFESTTNFNAEAQKFNCIMENGETICLDAIFTLKDIKKDEEIRMSYQYSPAIVNQAMTTSEIMVNFDETLLLETLTNFLN